jgi:diacylglycerol O-acyltransferase
VEKLIPSTPRFRAVAQPVPLSFERPVWVDAPDFSVADHVTASTFEGADGKDPVEVVTDRLATSRFDPKRPPWTMELIEGLPENRWMLAAHLHVALIDGLGSTDLYSCVLVPRVTPPPAPPFGPPPSGQQLLTDAIRDLLLSPYEQVRFVRAMLRRSRPEPSPPPPVETHRVRTLLDLDRLKAIKDVLGGSVNDVLAAIVASAAGGVDGRNEVSVTVPFAVRSLSRPGQYDNQVEAAEVLLPTSIAKPVDHFRAVSLMLDRVARDNLAVGGKLLGRIAGPTPFVLLALGSRGTMQASADVVLVNAPGPPKTGKVFSGRSVEAHALVPHPPGIRWCVTSFSHGGKVSVGVSGHDSAAVSAFAASLDKAYEELGSAAAART